MQDKNLIDVNLTSEMKTSFIDYAMSVIVARALPDVRDGLKPVHRRILYGMNELGVTPDKPHKKSARITGDVMGKYHPHGDSSIYEAMVRMAQWWSYRHMLVDGHGNFGSMDGDGAAAQRYTEARMSKIALEMLRDINKNTVDFQDNYDGSEREPLVLPSRFPNLLVNGATGIAVGMATNIPPHNLGESIDAVKLVMDNPDVTTRELMEVLTFQQVHLLWENLVFVKLTKQVKDQSFYVLALKLKQLRVDANVSLSQNSHTVLTRRKYMNTLFA